MKHDVSMCNISMERKICMLHGGIKTAKLHNLINQNTNLNSTKLRTLDLISFQTCWKFSESKTVNNFLCNISINIQYNYKYILVKIEGGNMFEF